VDRELVLLVLALLATGPMMIFFGTLPDRPMAAASARRLERLCWLRIWLPLLPAAITLAAVIGWASREPEDAEGLPWWMLAAFVLLSVPLVRAVLRALRAALAKPSGIVIGTAGLLRPQVLVAPAFEQTIEPEVLRAALEHEAAHVRHLDPLRLFIARFASDLQWPLRAPQARLAHWRNALELARDEEARRRGTDGADLAAAVLAAAQHGQRRGLAPALGLEDEDAGLQDRIARLLSALPEDDTTTRHAPAAAAVASSLIASCILGALHGEQVVQALLVGVR